MSRIACVVGAFCSAAVATAALAAPAAAHQDGCHRWHSCPSDTGSYVCGDLGYDSECYGSTVDPSPVDPEPYDRDYEGSSSLGGYGGESSLDDYDVFAAERAEAQARLDKASERLSVAEEELATAQAAAMELRLPAKAIGRRAEALEELALDARAQATTAEDEMVDERLDALSYVEAADSRYHDARSRWRERRSAIIGLGLVGALAVLLVSTAQTLRRPFNWRQIGRRRPRPIGAALATALAVLAVAVGLAQGAPAAPQIEPRVERLASLATGDARREPMGSVQRLQDVADRADDRAARAAARASRARGELGRARRAIREIEARIARAERAVRRWTREVRSIAPLSGGYGVAGAPSGADGTYNCADFATQQEAQDHMDAYGDIDGLDGDSDGVACQSLP